MNLVRLADGAGGAVIRGTLGPAVLRGTGAGRLLGLRPEEITLVPGGVPARVLDVDYLGADTIVACAVGDERLAVRIAGRPGLAAGTPIQLGWAPDAMHCFDEATGRRLPDSAPAALGATGASLTR
jgi:sn-glycerol 3-phosphate transport system ATP-binding protein